ncbi:MAG: internal scaffolding protein [Microviridae sp.]|nr:MAG: internal scaffolding protein [Microviridae sp.]
MSRAFRESGLDQNDRMAVARFCDTDCSKDELVTVQADAKEVDINTIVARMEKGKPFPMYNGEPFYGDVSNFTGLQDAIIKIQDAEDLFMEYPADVRKRFNNNYVEFFEFFEDDKNRQEAEELGFIAKKPIKDSPAPAPVPVVPPAPVPVVPPAPAGAGK